MGIWHLPDASLLHVTREGAFRNRAGSHRHCRLLRRLDGDYCSAQVRRRFRPRYNLTVKNTPPVSEAKIELETGGTRNEHVFVPGEPAGFSGHSGVSCSGIALAQRQRLASTAPSMRQWLLGGAPSAL